MSKQKIISNGVKIIIDQEKCIGCGTCEAMCPQVFKMDPATYKAKVLKKEGSPECHIQEIVQACSVEAIIVQK